MENVKELWELLAANGLPGIVLGIGVFVIVYFGRFSGFVKNGAIARVAAAFTALMLGGAELGQVDNNVMSIVAILVSGLIHELKDYAESKKG